MGTKIVGKKGKIKNIKITIYSVEIKHFFFTDS